MNIEFKTQLITGLLSSPIVYIHTSHVRYVDEMLSEILQPSNGSASIVSATLKNVYEYDLARGVVFFDDKSKDSDSSSTNTIYDFVSNLIGLDGETVQISLIKNLNRDILVDSVLISLLSTVVSKYEEGVYNPLNTIILVSPEPVENLPHSILDLIQVIEIKVPDFNEIQAIVSAIPISKQVEYIEDSIRTEFARNLQGLRLSEIRQILRSTLVRTSGKLSRQTISLALQEKKEVVRKSGIIEVVDTDEQLDNIGGLENLVEEIKRKKVIFEHLSLAQNKNARVPIPKGLLIIGMPGCGKSMIAKSIASEFNVALLRLDVNRLMGKYVGESELNLRRALETAEAAHPCVLWIDEIEKAFAGTDSGNNDIIIRLMGHFLTWMQERKSAVYVVATANDTLKPELMRKGRFDDVFFVDFPNRVEAESILKKCIHRYSDAFLYDWSSIKDKEVAKIVSKMYEDKCRGFSGAEINSLVESVVEKTFREYILKEEESMSSNINLDKKIKITKDILIEELLRMRGYVMSGQLDSEKPDSAIKRISKLKKEFNLKSASK